MGGSPASVVEIGVEILRLAKKYNLRTFFETGTFQSETALWAVHHFDKVYTVERDPRLFLDAQAHTQEYPNKLAVLYGDSVDVLEDELPIIDDDVIFWLDAHAMGDQEGGSPVLEELAVIAEALDQPKAIVIDDVLLFEMHTPGWPTPSEVQLMLRAMGLGCKHLKDVYVAEILEE